MKLRKRRKKNKNNIVLSEKDNFIIIFHEVLSYLAVGTLLFLAIGLKDIDNYTDWLSFAFFLFIIGILIGMSVYFILRYFIPQISTYKNSKGVGFLLPLICGFTLITFGSGTLLNESKSQNTECKKYIIQEMRISGFKYQSYDIFIYNGFELERLSFGKAFYNEYKVGDEVDLCIITGRLGFKYYRIKQ